MYSLRYDFISSYGYYYPPKVTVFKEDILEKAYSDTVSTVLKFVGAK